VNTPSFFKKKHGETPPPLTCPSCGRETGGAHLCPHCGADTVHRVKEKTLVLMATFLVVIGGLLFVVAEMTQEPQPRTIASLGMDDMYDHVRIVGTVVSEPRFYPEKYDPQSGIIKFRVNDTTGELNVKLEKPVTKDVIKNNRVPGVGDIIDVRGTLYVGEGWMQITCITPEFLKVKERDYQHMTIKQIKNSGRGDLREYALVEVTGNITDVRDLGFAVSFRLTDAWGNYVTVFVRDTIIELTSPTGKLDQVYNGVYATVKGALVWYSRYGSSSGYWEIVPTSAETIISHGPPPKMEYPHYTLEDLMKNPEENEGLLVKVTDLLVSDIQDYTFTIYDPSSGYNLTVYAEYGANITGNISIGAIVDIQGVFMKYYDMWELKVRAAGSDYILVKQSGEEVES